MDTQRIRHPMALSRSVIASLLCALLLTGCAAAVVTGAAVGIAAVHDRRPVGKQIDDQSIELRAGNRLRSDEVTKDARIKVLSFNGVVLVAGEVPTKQQGQRALELIRTMEGPREVVNELYVTPKPGVGRRSRDTLLTAQVKSALLGVRLKGFDPTRVKVLSTRGIVYLMGLVSQAEGDAAAERVRRVRGVRRVVKVFEYSSPAPS